MNELIDRIYECAFNPELWPSVLDAMAQIAEARGAYLLAATPDVSRWTASDGIRAGLEEVIAGGWIRRSQRFSRLAAARRHGFVTEHDIFTDEELAADPMYRDLLWPRGLGWAAANMIALPTGDSLIFVIERPRARGPIERPVVDRLDLLYPHVARSALVAARLQLERARAASETLGLIGLPSLVFDATGVVMAANHLIEGLTDHVRWLAKERFSLKDSAADLLLTNAMTALQLEHGRSPQSFPLRDRDGRAAMVAHVVPVRGSSRDVFVRCAGVLILTPVGLPKAPPVELIASLFDLTPAEARVARSLTAGNTLDGVADDFSISRHTARSHLRAALDKTGCSRQVELVALLGGLGPRAFGA